MLKCRVIPCLDVKDGRVVKGVNFVDLIDAGDPVEAAKAYDAAGADELCFLDITASSDNRETIFDVVARTAEQCFMPLTVGGGVRTVADIRKLLLAGADKVSINTAAVNNPDFIAEAADKFGNQCIVVAIDAKKVSAAGDAERWEIFTHGGRKRNRHRCGRIRRTSSQARRRRDPAHLDGPRRHQGRLRHRAHPRHRRCGACAGNRQRRRRHARPSGRRHSRRPRDGRACRLDLPFRHLHDRRGQGAYGRRRGCRQTRTLQPVDSKRHDMADFTLADLERIVADRGRSGDPGIRGRPSCSRAAWTRLRKSSARKPSRR